MATINILGTGTPGTAITKNATDVAQTGLSSANGAFVTNNILLAADTAGSVKSLPSTNSAVLVTNVTGTPSYSTTMTDGQLIIGSTGGTPTAATLTAGSNITITNGPGTISIAATGGGGVNAGTINQLAYYAATGSTVSGLATANNGLLVTSGTGVPSIGNAILADITVNGVRVGRGSGNIASNTALGNGALASVTTSTNNVGIGDNALAPITTGANNVGIGSSALLNAFGNSTQNVVVGSGSCTGSAFLTNIVAIGFQNQVAATGGECVSIGSQTLRNLTSGVRNIGIGNQTLRDCTISNDNTVVGYSALRNWNGALGGSNTIYGSSILLSASGNITNNVLVGSIIAQNAIQCVQNHIVSNGGFNALTTGGNNTALGFNIATGSIAGSLALTTGSNNTLIGFQANVNAINTSNAIALGANSIAIASTGTTSITNGPGISFGSSITPVGFRGDGTIYTGGTGRGYWRPNINGTPYLMPLFVDGTLTARASMVTDTNGSPILSSSMADGALIIGSSTGTPAAATLTQGTYITVTNAANSITINTVGPVMTTVNVTGTSQAAAVNTRYLLQNAAATTVTTPATCALGDRITICGAGGASWVVQMNTGQTLYFSNSQTTAGGTMTANHEKDSVTITCIVANTDWVVESFSSGAKFTNFT